MTKEIRLIAFDMDGTVLYNGSEISERLQNILRRAMERGIYVVPCTGRGRKEVPATVEALPPTFTITSNGALGRDERKNQVIYTNLIDWEMAVQIYEDLKERDVFVTTHIDGTVYFQSEDEAMIREKYHFPDYINVYLTSDVIQLIREKKMGVEKVYARPETEAEREQIKERLVSKYPLFFSSSSVHNMEFSILGCSKGTALKWLCEDLGIDPSQVVAFGDGENDKEMLAYAGIGVAMGNGHEACKAAADEVIGTCAEDAVADYLEKLLG